MKTTRRQFCPEEKVRILRLHLLEKKPISQICEQYGLNPNLFYRWQKEFFEHGAIVFKQEGGGRNQSPTKALEKDNLRLKAKLARKDEVIAEIMADQVQLKKELGLG